MFRGTRHKRAVISAIAGMVLLVAPTGHGDLLGQATVQRAIECFAAAVEAGASGCSDAPDVTVAKVMLDPAGHSPAVVHEVLAGLEGLALASPVLRVRLAAAAWLMVPGETDATWSSEIVSRAERLYRSSMDAGIRQAVVSKIARQKQAAPAVRFLVRVATEEGDPSLEDPEWPTSYVALGALAMMGEDGRAALRALAPEGVPDARARGYFEHLARNDFRLRPP